MRAPKPAALPPHERRKRILAALYVHGSRLGSADAAIAEARRALRAAGIRADISEVEQVGVTGLLDVLYPPCDCAAEPGDGAGPHHHLTCPKWRLS